jgi:hypothetical protein
MPDVWYVVYGISGGTIIDRLRTSQWPNGLPLSCPKAQARGVAQIKARLERWSWFRLYQGIDALTKSGYS